MPCKIQGCYLSATGWCTDHYQNGSYNTKAGNARSAQQLQCDLDDDWESICKARVVLVRISSSLSVIFLCSSLCLLFNHKHIPRPCLLILRIVMLIMSCNHSTFQEWAPLRFSTTLLLCIQHASKSYRGTLNGETSGSLGTRWPWESW